jgi:ABC-type uncharacterized transport system substrate-binding protein
MDLRWGGGDNNRIGALAHELVGLQPDIILADSTPATVALQRETRMIPIVFAAVADPVRWLELVELQPDVIFAATTSIAFCREHGIEHSLRPARA